MKLNKTLQLAALAGCAVSIASTFGSCKEELLIENYSTVLKDSTYFTYNVDNFKESMANSDILHIYTYELGKDTTTSLKYLKYTPQNGAFSFSKPKGSGDKIVVKPLAVGKEYQFHYGAGSFWNVALIERKKKNPSMDLDYMREIMKYPSITNLKKTDFEYKLFDFDGIFKNGYRTGNTLESPQFAWEDLNEYLNADSTEAKYVKHTDGPEIVVGYSMDELKVGERKSIDFDLQTITHEYNISLRLPIDDEANFKVNSIWALCSGIPEKTNMYTGIYDVENTHKIAFRFNNVVSGNVVTGDRSLYLTNISCGTDTIPGRPVSGPGVMQLTIQGEYDNKNIVVSALCNIYNSILEAGIIKETGNGWIWGGKTDLPITIVTKITKEMLDASVKGNTIILEDKAMISTEQKDK